MAKNSGPNANNYDVVLGLSWTNIIWIMAGIITLWLLFHHSHGGM